MANKLVPLLTLSQAKDLVACLESEDIAAANKIVESVSDYSVSETNMFEQVGELTRELHDALISFQNDTRLVDMAGHDLPDAQNRLNYVIEMTDKAANKTMDAVDACMPLADELSQDLVTVEPSWQKLMSRDLEVGEFKVLCHLIDDIFNRSKMNVSVLKTSLTDILMAQDFQDLTGQMIRRVIELVQEIESKLVGILTVCRGGDIAGQEKQEKQEKQEIQNTEKRIEAEGPIMHTEERDDVINGQDDVDDLLSSLGF